MSDTTNAASVWAVQSKLLEEVDKEYEWGDCQSFTSILIDECNGSRLDLGTDNTFDLGYVRAQASLNYHRKMFSSTQEFQIVLKKGRFDEVGKEFTFKGLAQTVD